MPDHFKENISSGRIDNLFVLPFRQVIPFQLKTPDVDERNIARLKTCLESNECTGYRLHVIV
jgi:hypothetical protein